MYRKNFLLIILLSFFLFITISFFLPVRSLANGTCTCGGAACSLQTDNCDSGYFPSCNASTCSGGNSCTCIKSGSLVCNAVKLDKQCPDKQPVRCGNNYMCCQTAQDCPASLSNLEGVYSNVVKYAFGIAGIVLFILLIMAGFRFITSGGDPKAVEGAKRTMTSALFGFIIILVAYLILVVIKLITGVDVTKFNILIPS